MSLFTMGNDNCFCVHGKGQCLFFLILFFTWQNCLPLPVFTMASFVQKQFLGFWMVASTVMSLPYYFLESVPIWIVFVPCPYKWRELKHQPFCVATTVFAYTNLSSPQLHPIIHLAENGQVAKWPSKVCDVTCLFEVEACAAKIHINLINARYFFPHCLHSHSVAKWTIVNDFPCSVQKQPTGIPIWKKDCKSSARLWVTSFLCSFIFFDVCSSQLHFLW